MTTAATCAIDEAPSHAATADSYEYDAFGNEINHTGTTPNNYLYRGEQYDPDLGLYYLRARYHNTMTGRFMSRDPNAGMLTDPKSLHKYLYAGGDPVNGLDPMGRETMLETGDLDALIDEPALPALREFATNAARILCVPIKELAEDFSAWPPAAPSPVGVPVWLIKLIAALCTGSGN